MSSLDSLARLEVWFRFATCRQYSRRQKQEWLNNKRCVDDYLEHAGRRAMTSQQARQWRALVTFASNPDTACLTLENDAYPDALRHIDHPPWILYAKGNLDLLLEPALAVVGSRRPSDLGCHAVDHLVGPLAALGVVTVSGLALGIDALAHQSALNANAGTVAVLANGIDVVYPARHRQLQSQIERNGLLISEYPPGAKAAKHQFVERNRLVSGLALGVLVIEAAARSGTLTTARWALEQNKEVFVLPGSVFNPQYEGSHRLIQQGALLVHAFDDILDVLRDSLGQIVDSQQHISNDFSCVGDFGVVLGALQRSEATIDQIIEQTGLTASAVSRMLIELELQGAIIVLNDGRYALKPIGGKAVTR